MASLEQVTGLLDATVGKVIANVQKQVNDILGEFTITKITVDRLTNELENIKSKVDRNHYTVNKGDDKMLIPEKYGGDKSTIGYHEWSFKFMIYASRSNKHLKELMTWARNQSKPIEKEELEEKAMQMEIDDDEMNSISANLYAKIVSCVSEEAFTLVMSIGDEQQGLETWRRLCSRFDPNTSKATSMGLSGIMCPPKLKNISEVQSGIEKWETKLNEYHKKGNDELPQKVLIELMVNMMPEEIGKWARTEISMGRAGNTKDLRNAIISYIQGLGGSAPTLDVHQVEQANYDRNWMDMNWNNAGPTNTTIYQDLDYAVQEKGKGKGGWKGAPWQFQRYQKGGGVKGKSEGKGGGKGGMKGGPKGKGPQEVRRCHTCGSTNHLAAWCPYNWSRKGGKPLNAWEYDVSDGDHGGGWVEDSLHEWHGTHVNLGTAEGEHEMQLASLTTECRQSHDGDTPITTRNRFSAIREEQQQEQQPKHQQLQQQHERQQYEQQQHEQQEQHEQQQQQQEQEDEMNFMKVARKKALKRWKVPKGAWKPMNIVAVDTIEPNAEDKKQISGLEIEVTTTGESDVAVDTVQVSEPGWTKIEATIDSGAADNVMPEELFGHLPKTDGNPNIRYVAANGDKIPNRGARQVPMYTDDWQRTAIKFQLTDVNKPLISVGHITARKHVVILDEHEGWIINKATGGVTRVHKKNNVYVLPMWVKDFQGQASRS